MTTVALASDALARVAPYAMAGGGFDEARFANHYLLPPEVMLARSRLCQDLASREVDALEAEERGPDPHDLAGRKVNGNSDSDANIGQGTS